MTTERDADVCPFCGLVDCQNRWHAMWLLQAKADPRWPSAQGDSASTPDMARLLQAAHDEGVNWERRRVALQRDSATTEGAVRELKALSDKATPGVWVPATVLGGARFAADVDFEIAAVNYVRALLADVPDEPRPVVCTCAGPTSDGGHRAFCALRAASGTGAGESQ